MSSHPKILITCANASSVNGFPALQLNKNYVSSVSAAGGFPLPVADTGGLNDYVSFADGLILTGGADIEPQRYDENSTTTTLHCDPVRDRFEFELARAFLKTGKPILGICRGFQLINVLLGGSLIQDIVPICGALHGGGKTHLIKIAPASILLKLFGDRIIVNSFHHQAITPARLASVLRPIATCIAGSVPIIEAFEHPNYPLLGVQWHPERMLDDGCNGTPNMMPLFEWFIKICQSIGYDGSS